MWIYGDKAGGQEAIQEVVGKLRWEMMEADQGQKKSFHHMPLSYFLPGRGYMYTWNSFMMLYSRKEHNIVNKYSPIKKNKVKKQ